MTIPTITGFKPIAAIPTGLAAGAGLGFLLSKMIKGQEKHKTIYIIVGAIVLGGVGYLVADKS